MSFEDKRAVVFRCNLVCFALALILLASGCATPIGVNYVDQHIAYQSITANILSADRPSSFSARELMNLNLYQRFEDEPEKALAEMHAGLTPQGDEDRLFALTELSFAHAGCFGGCAVGLSRKCSCTTWQAEAAVR